MNQIDVLGIELTDDTAKIMVKEAWKYIGNGAMNTILYVSSRILLEAGVSEEYKARLQAMDMTVFGETGVIPLTLTNYRERKKEVEEEIFLSEYLKRISRNKKKILVLADSEEHVEALSNYLLSVRDHLLISSCIVEEMEDADLINEINDAAPSVIISGLETNEQMRLMSEYSQLINADVWIALLENMSLTQKREHLLSKMTRLLYKRVFRRKVSSYNQKEKTDSSEEADSIEGEDDEKD